MGSKNRKSKKGGISQAKKKNIKGGKMSSGKKTKNKTVVLARRKLQAVVRKKLQNRNSNSGGGGVPHEVNMEDVLDMIDDEDLAHLKGEDFKDRQYFVKNVQSSNQSRPPTKRRIGEDEETELEENYENKLRKVEESEKRYKMLLPVKTRTGFHMQVTEDLDDEEEEEGPNESVVKDSAPKPPSSEEDSLKDAVVSLGKLVAQRRAALLQYKLRIGTLSAGFLEDPHNRIKNLDAILMIMDGNDPAVAFIVPKLCALSLLAVFRDVLPSYAIKHFNAEGTKLKKDTLHLQTFETNLLAKYKMYLKKLENFVTKYCPKRKPSSPLNDAEASLGTIAFECMSGMLTSHPYFNMSTNIANFLVPYLNNWNPLIRLSIFNSIKSLFRVDKRGEISYEIVRRINDLIKSKMAGKGSRVVHQEVLNVLLALRIKEVDLQKEKEEELNPSKKLTFEQRRMLSKRKRKKAKDLVLLEKELLEASAEENKDRKSRYLTDITKLVFTIYFRALKNESNSKILSCVLEGLSKFAHVINVDFFDDILKVLERLLNEGNLKQRQILLCISTVLAVLDGQGSALTLDPTSFHKHLYRALSNLRCGKPETDVGVALRCVRLGLGRHKMPGPRAVAFAKRLSTTALQIEHQDSAAILMELKQILRLQPSVNILFDCDGGGASGVYMPELDDPDHSSANASTMWEITSLTAHYHPWVSQIAKTFVNPNEKVPSELMNVLPETICQKFDPSFTMDFHPTIPERKVVALKAKPRHLHFTPKTDHLKDAIAELKIDDKWDETFDKIIFM